MVIRLCHSLVQPFLNRAKKSFALPNILNLNIRESFHQRWQRRPLGSRIIHCREGVSAVTDAVQSQHAPGVCLTAIWTRGLGFATSSY